MMTSERRVSMSDVTSCDCVGSAVHSDRRSRSVDSGLVTDVDSLQQRAPTTVTVSDAGSVEPSPSAALCSRVVGSCDSGLPQHVERDGNVYDTQDLVQELSDELSDCDCSTVSSSQHRDDVTCHSSSVSVTNNRQSWLLRLFESKLFDMSIAIQYLFNSKESGVQTYIGESRCFLSENLYTQ